MKKWEVESDGVKHEIQYKQGFGRKIIVDGETYKVKSANPFINVIDYDINLGSTDCKLVVIGSKADLAINGTFLGSQKPYAPVSNVAPWIWVFVGISTLGGFLLAGIFAFVLGALMSTLYIQLGIQKKKGAVIGSFIGCTVAQLIFFVLVVLARLNL